MPGNFPILHQDQFNFCTLYKRKEKKEKMFHIYFITLTILLAFFFIFRIFKCFQKKYSRYSWIFSMAILLSLKQWRELEWTKGLLKNANRLWQERLFKPKSYFWGFFFLFMSLDTKEKSDVSTLPFYHPFTKIQITIRTMVLCA